MHLQSASDTDRETSHQWITIMIALEGSKFSSSSTENANVAADWLTAVRSVFKMNKSSKQGFEERRKMYVFWLL